jgi:myosin heavy subunit
MYFTDLEIDNIIMVVAGILHLGNLEITGDDS